MQSMEISKNAVEERKQFENVFSRLISALGDGGQDTLRKLQQSSVLVIGMKGLGIEIGWYSFNILQYCTYSNRATPKYEAKNLILMGIQGLSIFDDEPVEIADLSANVCSKYSIFALALLTSFSSFWKKET